MQVLCGLIFTTIRAPAFPQSKDQLHVNLQNILDAATTDFREYRANKTAGPDVSIEGTKVPCQMTTWANNVPMYICYAQVPLANGKDWYARTIEALQGFNPTWHFQIKTPGEDHYVDAGPLDCEIPPTEGPYAGQCPLHLQVAKQADGTAKLYLWVNSLSSPYLLKHASAPPPKTVPPAVVGGCDDFCQGLKKAFEARTSAFEDIRTGKSSDGTSAITVKLAGAKECSVNAATGSPSHDVGTQYVCYWRDGSGSAAVARFRDLVSRFQVLAPSDWSTRQGEELDEYTGTNMTAWYAVEPGAKHDVRIYVSGESVGLHITAWN